MWHRALLVDPFYSTRSKDVAMKEEVVVNPNLSALEINEVIDSQSTDSGECRSTA